MAASVCAEVTVSGQIRMRGNVSETDFDLDTDAVRSYDGRVKLKVDAKLDNGIQGVLELQSAELNDNGGLKANDANWKWGSPNIMKGSLMFRQAWVLFLLGNMVKLKVGHRPLALGTKIFFDWTYYGTDAITLLVTPTDKLLLGAITFKIVEGSGNIGKPDGAGGVNEDDEFDADAYMLLGAFSGGPFNVSGDITYVNFEEKVGDETLTNFSVRGDTTVGPAKVWGDVGYQIGTDKDPAGDVDKSAYAIALRGDFNIADLKLWLAGGIGSGNDAKDTDNDDSYTTLLSADSRNAPFNTFVFDFSVEGATGGTNGGISNLTAIQIGAKHQTTESLSLDGAVTYLKATEDVKDENDIGTEIDARVKYKISKNLTYFIEGGYLLAGDFYEKGLEKGDDDSYRVRHGIVLNF